MNKAAVRDNDAAGRRQCCRQSQLVGIFVKLTGRVVPAAAATLDSELASAGLAAAVAPTMMQMPSA